MSSDLERLLRKRSAIIAQLEEEKRLFQKGVNLIDHTRGNVPPNIVDQEAARLRHIGELTANEFEVEAQIRHLADIG